jgi:hypothetical protein
MLREYSAAMAAMAQIADALKPLAAALDVPAPPPPASPPPARDSNADASHSDPSRVNDSGPGAQFAPSELRADDRPIRPARPELLDVEITAPNEVTILEFEEQLSELPGVRRVALKSYANGKATLSVELQPVVPASEPESAVSVVCAWCGKLLTVGDSRVSHGLCHDCAAKVESSVGQRVEPVPAELRPRTGDEGIVYLARNNGHWFESKVGANGVFEEAPTGFPALTSAQQVLRRVQAKYPDRMVVISGDGLAARNLAATPA